MQKQINVLSPFGGVECARMALERRGIQIGRYFSSEIDPYAIKCAAHNFQDIMHIGSVTEVCVKVLPEIPNALKGGTTITWGKGQKGEKLDGPLHLLLGGPPCQDLSIAGARAGITPTYQEYLYKKREGLPTSRSDLFWEFYRLKEESQPLYFIMENVASMPKYVLEIISEALGVEPIMINSALVSAQNRKRLYWVGKRNDDGTYSRVNIPQPEDRGIVLRDILEDIPLDDPRWKKVRPEYLDTLNSYDWGVCELNRVGKLRQGYEYFHIDSKASSITVAHASNRKIIVAVPKKSLIVTASYINKNQKTFFERRDGQMVLAKDDLDYYARKLTVREGARLQGFPETYEFPVSDSRAFKGIGNGWQVDKIDHILSFIDI